MALSQLRITSRTPFAEGRAFGDVGPYERLDGTLELAVDPAHPANAGIADLDLAPRDSRGLVACSADVSILAPADPERGNGRVLLDVLNRGKRRALKYFNAAGEDEDPAVHLDPGNGFLMRHGYTVAWCGWQYDVPDAAGLLRLRAPDAVTREGAPISGRIMVTYQPNTPTTVQPLAHAGHRPYPAMDVEEPDALLLERDYEDAEPRRVPRDRWAFARVESGAAVPDASHVHFPEGFKPGKTYQFVYTTVGAPVVGLGLVATRDLVSLLKHGASGDGNPCAGTLDYAYGFGASQSGRFLRLFLYLGLNRDETARTVFDGVVPHIAGGRRGEFNQRFGQPSNTEKRSAGCLFPFTDGDQTDPDTGVTDGLLSRLAASGGMPKVMLTNSSSEYWRGDGSLVHTDVGGSHDVSSRDTVRIYHFAGTQHASGIYPPTHLTPVDGFRAQQRFNCVDYTPLLRAALVNLDRWAASEIEPPASRHPAIGEATAVRPEETRPRFTAIPGVEFPAHLPHLSRLDFGPGVEKGVLSRVPALVGAAYPGLVSAVDEDANEIAGVRLPDVAVPLATYAGWNLRHPDIGGSDQVMDILGLFGSTIPFPSTETERRDRGDPRRSIEERYGSKAGYLGRVRRAAEKLAAKRFLLEEDVDEIIRQAGERYDLFTGAGAA